MSSPTAGRSRPRLVLTGLSMLMLAAFITMSAAFYLSGGRGFVVRTPSMGTAAPVGTLVLTRPTTVSALHVGDVIAFHPPTEPTETYTHRIIEIRDGAVFTRGDINGTSDPWRLQASNIVGRAVLIVPRLGWLIRALPLLVVGNLVVWAFTALWVRRERRGALRMAGASLVFALAAQLLQPFLGLVQLETTTLPNGHAAITVVSTGLLPVRVSPVAGHGHAHPIDVAMGQVGVSRLSGGSPTHEYLLHSALHLSVLGWIGLVFVWLSPLLWMVIRGDGSAEDDRRDSGPAARRGSRVSHRRLPRRVVLSAATLMLAAAALIGLQVSVSQGAFIAKIANSTDSAATNPYFTCTAYATDTVGAVRATFDYPFSESSDTGSAADASGSGNIGTYSTAGVTATSNTTVCPRDKNLYVAAFNGSSGYVMGPTTAVSGPNTFTIEAWFKTSTAAGKIIGFGNSSTATASSNYDRHLYVGSDGYLYFGVYPNAVVTVTNKGSTLAGVDTSTVTDGLWHFAVGTLSSSGMALYLDGKLVATNTATTTAQNFSGYWRVGFDNMSGWTNSPSTGYFNGQLAWAAAYNSYALSATQVAQQYAAGH